MARNLEHITQDYWRVSHGLKSPNAPVLTVEKALGALNSSDMLRPTDWRLNELMHTIRFDIIEGNSEWREEQRVAGSLLTLPTRD